MVMNSTRAFWVFVLFLTSAFSAAPSSFAETERGSRQVGFVKIAKDRELYVDYQKPVGSRPTVVLLNGLTYKVESWDAFTRALQGDGIGVLRYDMQGQGRSLLRIAPLTRNIDYREQVEDLALLLDALRIRGPVHLVGLSYGGAIGLGYSTRFPARVASLVLMAPFVAPLKAQDDWIRLQVQQARILNPSNPASYDDLYDFFLRIMVFATYPAAEPVVMENPFKLEATYRLTQGVRKFNATEIMPQLPTEKIHLVIARQDQYVGNSVHDEFWDKLPPRTRSSRLYIEGSEHKIPEVVPGFAATWVRRIVEGDPLVAGGRTFVGTPWRNEVSQQGAAARPAGPRSER